MLCNVSFQPNYLLISLWYRAIQALHLSNIPVQIRRIFSNTSVIDYYIILRARFKLPYDVQPHIFYFYSPIMGLLGAFAIIFKYGEWADQFRQFLRFLATYEFLYRSRSVDWRIVILKKYSFLGKCLTRTAYKFFSRISWSLREFIFPSTGAV